METSRRHLIKLGLYATASLVTFKGLSGRVLAAAQHLATADWPDGSWLRRDMFEALVGEYFTVYTPSSVVGLRLIAVEDVLSARNAETVGHPDCYTVLLAAPAHAPKLPQDTYRVVSNTLGAFMLFLVPGPETQQGITYSATFNRVTA